MRQIKKQLRRHIFLVLSVVVLIGNTYAQHSPELIYANYKSAIGKILMYDAAYGQLVGDETAGFISRGTGFFVTDDGIMFTNRHVVEHATYGYMIVKGPKGIETVTYAYYGMEKNLPAGYQVLHIGQPIPVVQVFKGDEGKYDIYVAEVLSLSESFDGAVLRITSDLEGNAVSTKFKTVALGNSEEFRTGEPVTVFGFPSQFDYDPNLSTAQNVNRTLNESPTMTTGVNSGKDFQFEPINGQFKTDAKIDGGNSGGPAFGKNNKVIGIATAKGTKTGIGLLGPINSMYTLTLTQSGLTTRLAALGLNPPGKASEIKTVSGAPRSIPARSSYAGKSGASSTSQASKVTIKGKVKSADSGGPVSNAVVGLVNIKSNGDPEIVSYGSTLSDGSFTLEPDVYHGKKYMIGAVADGYVDVKSEVLIDKEKPVFTITMTRKR